MHLNIEYLTEAELIELNHKIVERLRLIHSHEEMFKFKIGKWWVKIKPIAIEAFERQAIE